MSTRVKRKNPSKDYASKVLLCVLMAPILGMMLASLQQTFHFRSTGVLSIPVFVFLFDLALVIWSMIRLKRQPISAPLQLAWALTILLLPIAGPVTFLFLNPSEKK